MHEWVLATNYKYYRQGYGTGFIGKIMIDGKSSTVLVTNCHVMISGLDENYKKATEVTDKMKREMEENARMSEIQMGKKRLSLSDVLVEGSSLISPCKSVCFVVLDQNNYLLHLIYSIITVLQMHIRWCFRSVKNSEAIE